MRVRSFLRPNWYPDGPYGESPCIHCRQMLKHTGATSGITWIPVEADWVRDPSSGTCWSNEVERGAFGQHEPWEATPVAAVANLEET